MGATRTIDAVRDASTMLSPLTRRHDPPLARSPTPSCRHAATRSVACRADDCSPESQSKPGSQAAALCTKPLCDFMPLAGDHLFHSRRQSMVCGVVRRCEAASYTWACSCGQLGQLMRARRSRDAATPARPPARAGPLRWLCEEQMRPVLDVGVWGRRDLRAASLGSGAVYTLTVP